MSTIASRFPWAIVSTDENFNRVVHCRKRKPIEADEAVKIYQRLLPERVVRVVYDPDSNPQ